MRYDCETMTIVLPITPRDPPFPVEDMRRAFGAVVPKPNWKEAVDAEFAEGEFDLELMREAVKWYTGSEPTFAVRNGRVRVQAAGYYACIEA